MTLITQDDHLTAGVWAACDCHCDFRRLKYTVKQQKRFEGCLLRTKQIRIPNSLVRYTLLQNRIYRLQERL